MRALGLGVILTVCAGCVGKWGPDVPPPVVVAPPQPVVVVPAPVYVVPAPAYYYRPYPFSRPYYWRHY
jgi:hypothetical protein